MNNKKKGFTLVELLAVVTILAIVVLIGTNAISKVIRDRKEVLYKEQINSFLESVELWSMSHTKELPIQGSSKRITLGDLIDAKLVKQNIVNPVTNEVFSNDIYFCIKNDNGKYNYTYEGDC